MTAEWYDLGQRLHAARSGQLVARLTHSPLPPITHPVAVRARSDRHGLTVIVCSPDREPVTTHDPQQACTALVDHGVTIGADTWRTLVTDDPRTLPTLLTLARHADPRGPHADVAAHLGWWADRADFPATSAVVLTPRTCATRWATGTAPAAETDPGTWRQWLGVTDDSTAGLLDVLTRLSHGTPLPLIDVITDDDTASWHAAQSEHGDGWDWRHPDNLKRAATGLRARCDAADLYHSALLCDPLYRRRAAHTGHVVTATSDTAPGKNRIVALCDRMDARLRVGNTVTGWAGNPGDSPTARFNGTVAATGLIDGHLALTLSAVTTHRPDPGTRITLRPANTSPDVLKSGRRRYQRLYSTRTSWLTTGRTPTPHRRDVPLEVLIAAADSE